MGLDHPAVSSAFRQDRRGSFLSINRYFFRCFGSFAAVWVESELSSKADMKDATGEFRFVPKADLEMRSVRLTDVKHVPEHPDQLP
jgi:hypothetical protein